MSKQQLFVDAQVFQTDAWHRGMGKIAIEFLRALLRREDFAAAWDVTLVLNMRLKDKQRETEIKQALFDKAAVLYADLQLPEADGPSYKTVAPRNRAVLDALLGDDIADAVYFIPALFEHFVYPVYPSEPKKLLLFHDLIPFLFPTYYLERDDQRDYYFERYPEILASDLILANSDTTRDDLIRFLNIEPERVVSVYGAGFNRSDLKPAKPKGLDGRPIIMFPSGDDRRKNNERCVEAFAQFNRRHHGKYQLAIVSQFSDGTQQRLREIEPDITFVGRVSDGEFRWLLQHCEVLFWCPEYEGLGMPLLEAMTEPVERIVCSDISVFRELGASEPVVFADPKDPNDMARALDAVLKQKPVQHYATPRRFTWERTGELFFTALSQLARREVVRAPRPKIAIVGPDPRGYSSIGKFMAEVHPAISRRFDVEYYFEMSELTPGMPRPSFLPYVAPWHDVHELNAAAYARFDAVWFHLGNSDYHIESVKRALAYAGYIILHDTRLRGLFDQLVQRGHISEERYRIEESFGGLREAEFITSLANSAHGVLVHSSDAAEKVRHEVLAKRPENIRKLYHPIALGGRSPKSNQVTIGFGGFATPHADDIALTTLQHMLENPRFAHCRFEVFGYNKSNDNDNFINAVTRAVPADPRLRVTANLTDLDFQDKMRSLDIFVNYRPSYHGETSRPTLEAMRYGVCPVVRNVGWFGEIPDGAACKLDTPENIVGTVASLVQDAPLREAMQAAATAFAATLTADGYAAAMHELMQYNLVAQLPAAYRKAWEVAVRAQLPGERGNRVGGGIGHE